MHSPSRSRRRWSVVSAIVFLAALLPLQRAHSQATRVTSVDVAGNQKINKETILAVVSTKPGDEYSAERVERDRRAIESLGWFKVVGPPAVQQVPGGVRILFVVTEWPVLKSIQIAGNTVISEEQIRGAIKTKTEQVFNLAQWQNDVAAIEDLYKQKSYVAQALDNIDTPDFANTGILKVQVMELTIDAVKINGLHKTKTYVV